MLLEITFHILNLLMALAATAILIMIANRSKRGLGRVFKLYLGSAITLVIGTALQINQFTGLIPDIYEHTIFYISRFLATFFFLSASIVMLRIITKISK